MTDRDERHRRNAARLRAVVVEMAAEIVARGGGLDRYLLSDDEKAEALAKAPAYWRLRFTTLKNEARLKYAGDSDVL